MEWIKLSQYNLPPQGLKILCFNDGDVWVCRRLNYKGKDYWLEIPYGGRHGSILTHAPAYWMKPDYPDGFTGYIQIALEGEDPMILDEFQEKHPKDHAKFVKSILDTSTKPKKKK